MPKGSKAKTKLALSEVAIALLVIALGVVGIFFANNDGLQTSTVTVNDFTFKVRVADEPAERVQGLSGAKALANDEAMLFIFDKPFRHGIWMKDMKFSIDIAWIDENLRIIHLEENVSPSTYPDEFTPSVDALYVLEMYTGQAAAHGIGLGDAVTINL